MNFWDLYQTAIKASALCIRTLRPIYSNDVDLHLQTCSLQKGERKKQCHKKLGTPAARASSSRSCSSSWLPRARGAVVPIAASPKRQGTAAALGNHHRAEEPPSRRAALRSAKRAAAPSAPGRSTTVARIWPPAPELTLALLPCSSRQRRGLPSVASARGRSPSPSMWSRSATRRHPRPPLPCSTTVALEQLAVAAGGGGGHRGNALAPVPRRAPPPRRTSREGDGRGGW